MKDTVIYSHYCDSSDKLLKLIATDANLAERLCFLSVDGATEDIRAKLREFLYILEVDQVPTIFVNNRKYVGPDAHRAISTLRARGTQGKSVEKPTTAKVAAEVPPRNVEPFLMMSRNVSKPNQTQTQSSNPGNKNAQEAAPTTLFAKNSDIGGGYAVFGQQPETMIQDTPPQPEGRSIPKATPTNNTDLPPELVPVNTKDENSKSGDIEKRLQEMMAERAALTTSPPQI